MENVEQIISEILVDISGTKKVLKNKDLNLIDSGFLDSMGIVELLTEIEDRFNIEISLEEFAIEKFDTINKIKKYIEEKLK